ncbi:hypothetical protein ACFV4G_43405 [Kitasatospora sp. NPDC059747]|uniref:hypothetical protein n=1 Tax=Kitasatospora sp. NPDC059747 TaxID=3346930 RepID=UPI00365742EC
MRLPIILERTTQRSLRYSKVAWAHNFIEGCMGYSKMVVIFLDVLGSKNMKDFDIKFKIHNLFHGSIQDSQRRQSSNDLSHVAYDRKLFSFSDCAFIFYFYKEGVSESRKDANKLMSVALYNTSLLITKIMSEGFYVRGGATYGDAFIDDVSFFGPAVDCAYYVESKLAQMPRLLIDPEIGSKQYEYETEVYARPQILQSLSRTKKRISTVVMREGSDYYLNALYHLEMEGTLMYEGEMLALDSVKSSLIQAINKDIEIHNEKEFPREFLKLSWLKKYTENASCCLKEDVCSYSETVRIS